MGDALSSRLYGPKIPHDRRRVLYAQLRWAGICCLSETGEKLCLGVQLNTWKQVNLPVMYIFTMEYRD